MHSRRTTKSLGFIRVRRRIGSAIFRRPIGSASYDLVRAVRIDGKPRHKFVLGFGSLKDKRPERGKHSLIEFWVGAVERMKHHGLDEPQRRQLAEAMMRKGAPLPSIEQCRGQRLVCQIWPWMIEPLDEVMGWLS